MQFFKDRHSAEIPPEEEDPAQFEPGSQIVRERGNGLFQKANGIFAATGAQVEVDQLFEVVIIVGETPDQPLQVLDTLVGKLQPAVVLVQQVEGFAVGRSAGQKVFIGVHRLVRFLDGAVGPGQLPPALGVVRIAESHSLQKFDCFLVVA